VSCKTISREEFDNTTPVSPPQVKSEINPTLHRIAGLGFSSDPYKVLNHLKTLIPVGIAIIIVAAVKYARVSKSIPTVNMW